MNSLNNVGHVVGLQHTYGKSFAMNQASQVQIVDHGIEGDRIFAVFHKPKGECEGPLRVITFRKPEFAKLVLVKVEKTILGTYRFEFPDGEFFEYDPMKPTENSYQVDIWKKWGSGIEACTELSQKMSDYLETECLVLTYDEDNLRRVNEKYLPRNTLKAGHLVFQDGAQITFVDQVEIFRFNQVLAVHGKKCITTFPWWRMNVMLAGIEDLYSVKILRLGEDLRIMFTHLCQRCPGMNVPPHLGEKWNQGPEQWLTQFGWVGSTLISEKLYVDDYFQPYRRKGAKAHQPFFGINGIILRKFDRPLNNPFINLYQQAVVEERYEISL